MHHAIRKNLLAHEVSPYLLQHQFNPVDWYPWGAQAFTKAQQENKPILLSIGYSACHWCHVMAHESFENEEVAEIMNQNFVNIKVDREERPDLDSYYQNALSLLGRSGGWPLTMFLNTEGKPFWGGTYFPPHRKYNLPGFKEVLTTISDSYKKNNHSIINTANQIDHIIKNEKIQSEAGQAMSLDSLNAISDKLLSYMDPRYGGIAGAPKFPSPNLLAFFWRSYERTQSRKYKDAFLLAMSQMSKGGIYDHIGGGFSRYSTDQFWLVPHFEKMLYDNAQLIELLTLAWKETQDPLYLLRVEETIRWIERDMKLPEGGFASSLDADSEGHEGLYYVWYEVEIDNLLGDDAEYFKKSYDVTSTGNWEGKNILNLSNFRGNYGDERLARCRQILLEERSTRTPPHKDDKVLADWNGLMIHGLVQASLAFDKPEWLQLARNAFSFITENMIANGSIYHSWREGKINPVSFLSDYASLSRAALSLYQATFNEEYLRYAEDWTNVINTKYKAEDGGYNFLQKDVNEISSSLKELNDDPIPSGNSLALEVMVKLKVLTETNTYDEDIENQIQYFSSLMKGQPMMLATMLNAYELYHRYITVSLRGHPGDIRIFDFLNVAAKVPSLCVISRREIVNEESNVVLCRNFTCSDPLATPKELDEKLRKMIFD